jgi:hypothetical protein
MSTTTQDQNATTTQSQTRSTTECSICLEHVTGNKIITRCKHEFHKSCLERWMEEHATCPNCRSDIDDEPEMIFKFFFKPTEIIRVGEILMADFF